MASKAVIIACVALAIFDTTTAQCIKNFLPNCGCGVDQVILNQPGVLASNVLAQPGFLAQPGVLAPGVVAGNVLPGFASNVVSSVLGGQYAVPATNIIQDNTVATNLANTLQLLLVSNLLGNTLPNSPDLLTVPACSPYGGLGGLSYIC